MFESHSSVLSICCLSFVRVTCFIPQSVPDDFRENVSSDVRRKNSLSLSKNSTSIFHDSGLQFGERLQYGDTMTNIVVVQFSDYVQTGRDKRFNLTCLFRGPGEAVVTSGYIGAGYARSYRLRNRALHPVHLSCLQLNMECAVSCIRLHRNSGASTLDYSNTV